MTMTSEAGIPMDEVKQLLTETTQHLADTLNTLNDIFEEAGQSPDNLIPALESDSTSSEKDETRDCEDDLDAGAEQPKASSSSRTTWWIAGAGVTAVAVGAGVYLYTQTDLFDDGFSFSAVHDRAYDMIADKANQTRKEMGIDNDDGLIDDDNMTLLGRLGHAATFAANLVLTSVVTSIGEKARTYLDVDTYVESAHERLMEVVKEPLDSIQNAVEEQVQAVQEAVEDQVQAVQTAVQDSIETVQNDIATKVQDAADSASNNLGDALADVSDRMEDVVGDLNIQAQHLVDDI